MGESGRRGLPPAVATQMWLFLRAVLGDNHQGRSRRHASPLNQEYNNDIAVKPYEQAESQQQQQQLDTKDAFMYNPRRKPNPRRKTVRVISG